MEEVQSLSVSMLGTAADAEEVCNLTQQVWSDCIFENFSMDTIKYTTENGDGIHYHDDFNDALIQLFSDEEYIAKVSGIPTRAVGYFCRDGTDRHSIEGNATVL